MTLAQRVAHLGSWSLRQTFTPGQQPAAASLDWSDESGLQQAREHLPDLILLDLQLPTMNGDAVLTELRADPRMCHVPVLLLSADATAQSRERLLSLGANDYLSKPFGVVALLNKLDALLPADGPSSFLAAQA